MYFGSGSVRLIGFEVPNHRVCYAVCPGHRVLLTLLESLHMPLFQQCMRLMRRHFGSISLVFRLHLVWKLFVTVLELRCEFLKSKVVRCSSVCCWF